MASKMRTNKCSDIGAWSDRKTRKHRKCSPLSGVFSHFVVVYVTISKCHIYWRPILKISLLIFVTIIWQKRLHLVSGQTRHESLTCCTIHLVRTGHRIFHHVSCRWCHSHVNDVIQSYEMWNLAIVIVSVLVPPRVEFSAGVCARQFANRCLPPLPRGMVVVILEGISQEVSSKCNVSNPLHNGTYLRHFFSSP